MVFSIKDLAEGQLPAVKSTLYECPSGKTAIVKLISYLNTSAGAQVVNLYKKKSGSASRKIIPSDMSLKASRLMEYDNEQTLEAGDLIEGSATDAGVVDYTISGVEATTP